MPRGYWGFGNPDLAKFGEPSKDMGTPPSPIKHLTQKVCRTSSSDSPNELQELLDDGWKVIFATRLTDEIIEYILEKYV